MFCMKYIYETFQQYLLLHFYTLQYNSLFIIFAQKSILIIIIIKINKNNKMSIQQIHQNQRNISSSEDNCKCQYCKNQDEFKNHQRINPSHIYMFKHLKKRGGPPIKKQTFNKDYSQKSKQLPKKEELQKKIETEKPAATPNKPKLNQVLKIKQIQNSSFFIDYHQVSHSQRQKIPSKEALSHIIQQPRRQVNQQDLRNNGFNKQFKPRIESIKLVEISENPENIRLRYHHSRSLSQASAHHNELHLQNIYKSIQRQKKLQ